MNAEQIVSYALNAVVIAMIIWVRFAMKNQINTLEGTIEALEKRLAVPVRLVEWYEKRTQILQEKVDRAEEENEKLQAAIKGMPSDIQDRIVKHSNVMGQQLESMKRQLENEKAATKEDATWVFTKAFIEADLKRMVDTQKKMLSASVLPPMVREVLEDKDRS